MSRSVRAIDLDIKHKVRSAVSDINCCKDVVKERINFWRHIEETNGERTKLSFRARELSKAACKRISNSNLDVSSLEENTSNNFVISKSIRNIERSSTTEIRRSLCSLNVGSKHGTMRDKNRDTAHFGQFVRSQIDWLEGAEKDFLKESKISVKKARINAINSTKAAHASDANQNTPEPFSEEEDAFESSDIHSSVFSEFEPSGVVTSNDWKSVQTNKEHLHSYNNVREGVAIESPCNSPSSTVVFIDKVENFIQPISNEAKLQENCEPSLFQACRLETESEMSKTPIFQTEAMRLLEHFIDNGMAGVRGDACSGKTSVLYGAMKIFREKNIDWNIILVTHVDHLRACYNRNVLIVIDDILDQNDFMLDHLHTLKRFIDARFWKVIFSYSNKSSRIMESKPIHRSLLDGVHVLNISETNQCTINERIGVLNSHCKHIGYSLPEETMKQCVESVPAKYFFYYVRSYVNTEQYRGECAPIDFFKNPVKEMITDLDNFKASNPSGFYNLFCCSVVRPGLDISVSIENQLNEDAKEISPWLMTSNDKPDAKRFWKGIQCAVENVPTEFVARISAHQYQTKFDCVVRAVQLIILKELNKSGTDKLFKHALSLCDFAIIRCFLCSEDKAVNPLQLKIHENNFPHMAERFIAEIQRGHVRRIGRHPLLSNDDFKRIFIIQLRRKNEKERWDIFSKLDKHTETALIVFAVKHDKPDHTTNLTNFILQSRKWKKYSRKEGENVEGHLLVLQQNASAISNAVRYKDKSTHTCTALIKTVFNNLWKISTWKNCFREKAISSVIRIHAKILSEKSNETKEIMELFQNINIATHINRYKQSLLHLCVICGNEQILERALQHRKDEINCQDCFGQTPLHTAVQNNTLEAVRILIEFGAVIEIKDNDGNSAIHLAVHKSTNILEELICVNGTDVNIRNKDGKTPYQLACELEKTEHMKCLEMAYVDFD